MNRGLRHGFWELTSILPRLSFPQLLQFGLSFHCFPPPQSSLRKLSFKAPVTAGVGVRKCAREETVKTGSDRAWQSLGSWSSDSNQPLRPRLPAPESTPSCRSKLLAVRPGTPWAFSRGADDAGIRRRSANCSSPTEGRRTRAPEPSSPGLEGAGWPGWGPRSLPLQPRTAPAYQGPSSHSLRPDQNSCERLRLARGPSLDAHSDSLAR